MDDPSTHLLLLVSDLMARHLYDAVVANPDDEEVKSEFVELCEAFESVKSIYTEKLNVVDRKASIPLDIEKYLLEFAPEVFPITLNPYEDSEMLIIETAKPMSYLIAEELDARWPDIIVHAQAPKYS